jgi:hypothetical protein
MLTVCEVTLTACAAELELAGINAKLRLAGEAETFRGGVILKLIGIFIGVLVEEMPPGNTTITPT